MLQRWLLPLLLGASPLIAALPLPPPDIGIQLAQIPAGTFLMGSPDGEPWRESDKLTGEGPQTRVTISKPFWLARTLTTRAQYEALMGIASDPWPAGVADEWKKKGVDFGTFPIVNVTWDKAREYCAKLTEREHQAGRLPAGMIYTLPTEAQWEYACRAGTTMRNYAGDSDAALDDIAWYVKTTGPFNRGTSPRIQPVAKKKPNAWGLYDMLGNAREWVLDYIGPYPGGSVTDPTGPDSPVNGDLALRVQRGGCWIDTKGHVRSAARFWSDPSFGSQDGFKEGTVGFRVAVVTQ